MPFQGGGAGINALVGGNVDIAQASSPSSAAALDAGKVAPLAVAAAERMRYLKDMPTFNEALGGKDYSVAVIRFVVVPKAVPADRKAYLGAMVKAAMQEQSLRDEYTKLGVYFDPALEKAPNITEALNKEAEREREFYIKTGRLKP